MWEKNKKEKHTAQQIVRLRTTNAKRKEAKEKIEMYKRVLRTARMRSTICNTLYVTPFM